MSRRMLAAVLAGTLANAVGVLRADDRWTGTAADLKWKTGTNWSTSAMPGTSETALFDGAAVGTIQLEGFTRTLAEIHFANAYPGTGYTIAGGTLVLNQIVNDQFVNFPNNTISANVTAAGSTLTLTSNGGFLDLTGPLNAANLLVNGNGSTELKNTGNAFSAGIQVADGASLSGFEPGSFGTATITVGSGTLAAETVASSASFSNNVTITTGGNPTLAGYASGGGTVQMGTLSVGSSFVDYETTGSGTLAFNAAQLSGAATFTTSVSTTGFLRLGSVSETVPGSSISVVGGQLRLAGASFYTGGTNVDGGGLLELMAAGAVGSGPVSVFQDGLLKLTVAQPALPATTIFGFGALSGNTTGLHYSGASQNVFLNTNAILAIASGPVPVRGVDVNSAAYYLGITAANQIAMVGDNGSTSIYKGIAFGQFTPAGTVYTGTVSEQVAGQGIQAYIAGGTSVTLHGATFNTTNTATGVTFSGSGEVAIDAVPAGTATMFSFTGAGDASSQGTFIADLLAANVVGAHKTVNVSNGILYIGTASAVAATGTVNVGSGGTLMLSSQVGPTVNPSTGAYVVQSGGAIYLDGTTENLGGGASFTFQPGSLLALTSNANTSAGAGWTTTGADVVVTEPITVTGTGLVLANGRRLTTAAFSDATVSGGAVSAASGASVVLLTASTGQTLQVNSNVQVGTTTDLQIGEAIPFNSLEGTVRQSVGQAGTVQMYGASNTARNLIIGGGNLTFGDGAGDALSVAAIRQGALTIGNGKITVRPNGTITGTSLLNSLTINAGSLDLNDNDLVIDYTGATVLSTIRGYLQTGRNAGAWNGPGIASTAAATDAQQRTTIGYAEASQLLGLSGAATATWSGQTVDATSLLLKYTWYGDANMDGKVDADDYALIDRGRAKGLTGWINGDFNYDGVVNSADYMLMDRVYGLQSGVLSPAFLAEREAEFGDAYVTELVASVPEPGSMLIFALAGAMLSHRRTR
ncbi:MAG TPA: hypothetical protein VFE58_10510 [Tepidisphaeraceae bacterium]|nr:hypothetical protein [Tepidisphaeraceae bacterium]